MRSYRRGKGRIKFDAVGPVIPLSEEAGLIAYKESQEVPEGPDLSALMLDHKMVPQKNRKTSTTGFDVH